MRRILVAIAASAAMLSPFPTTAQICAPFTDVLASSAFCDDIQWIYNRGITLGCAPNQFCPADFVRRDQLAAFLYRLGFENAFVDGGNAFGATAVLGTLDDQPLDVRVNNSRVMRYEPNPISPNVIGGHPLNGVSAGVRGATIGGGGVPSLNSDPDFGGEGPNRVTDAYGTVSGGYNNVAGDAGGLVTFAAFATVGGGVQNNAIGFASTVGGGSGNIATRYATVAGGGNNAAIGEWSAVTGGLDNNASGTFSTVAGGNLNLAAGDYSFAAGRRALALTDGSFVWADMSNFPFQPSLDNQFAVRATGAVSFVVAINGSGGPTQYCNLIPGIIGWSCVSDRNAKENFEAAAGAEILEKLVAMPLSSWNYKGADPAIRNLGPTSQDFHATFGLGKDDATIATANLNGVALAAIQGLNAKLEARIADQTREIASLRAQHATEIAELRRAFELLVARVGPGGDVAASR